MIIHVIQYLLWSYFIDLFSIWNILIDFMQDTVCAFQQKLVDNFPMFLCYDPVSTDAIECLSLDMIHNISMIWVLFWKVNILG